MPEHLVLAWAKAAAVNVMGHTPQPRPDGLVRAADTDEAAVARLQEQRRRVVGAHIRLELSDDERDTLLAALDADLALLQGAQRASATWSLGIDWGMPTGDLNARLREVMHSIVLGPDMRPVAGVWMRQPHIDIEGDPDGMSMPNPAAQQVAGGWLVPFATDDRRRYGRPARSARTTSADETAGTKVAS